MHVAIVGSSGQLGCDLRDAFELGGHRVEGLTHEAIEIADPRRVREALDGVRPGLVVNTAAFHHLDRCEARPLRAWVVNALGARHLASWCAVAGSRLLHVSTDYVFDGSSRTPYVEDDEPGPINVYGWTKLAGEHWVRRGLDDHVIVRTSGLYGRNPCRGKGENFVERMLRLALERGRLRVVDDERVSPTSTADLARQIVRLAESGARGTYHAVSVGSCTWFQFAQEIVRVAGIAARVEPAAPGEFPARTPRPAYSVLENRALRREGLHEMRPWRDGLRDYLRGAILTPAAAGACRS